MLYLITNRHLVEEDKYLDTIGLALKGGVDAVILREKDLCCDKLLDLGTKIKKMTQSAGALFIVNGNIEAAEALCAEGYHTGFRDFLELRPRYEGLLGVSVHSLEEAVLAEQNGAGYLLASHIFETDCKPGLEPKGLKFVRDVKAAVKIPVIALGGINEDNAGQVIEAGAHGVAVMSGIMASANPYMAAERIKDSIKRAKAELC